MIRDNYFELFIHLNTNSLKLSSSYYSSFLLLDMIHTGGESLQDKLGDVWTCGMSLASAYVLCCLSKFRWKEEVRDGSEC